MDILCFLELPLCLSFDFCCVSMGFLVQLSIYGLGCSSFLVLDCTFSAALSSLLSPFQPEPHHRIHVSLLLLPLCLHELLNISNALLMTGKQGLLLSLLEMFALVYLLDRLIQARFGILIIHGVGHGFWSSDGRSFLAVSLDQYV